MMDSSDALAELLTLTLTVDQWGDRIYRNSSGQLHRRYGPAVEWANGYKVWYLNDQIHRIDGPAIEYATGTRVWYLNGQQLSEEEFIIVTKYPSGNPVQQCESH